MIGPGYREKEVKNRLAGEKQRQKKESMWDLKVIIE